MKLEWFYTNNDIRIQVVEGLNEIESVCDVFDNLSDLITVDEINPNSGEHWLENEGNLFSFALSDFNLLLDKGFCNVYYIGKLEDNIDINSESDLEFMKWYNN